MKYMLDTNICIYLLNHVPEVLSKYDNKRNEGVAISTITLAELEYGLCESSAYERNRKALLAFLAIVDVLPFDDSATIQYGKIRVGLERKGTLIGLMDMLIAAHAKSKGLVIVTNNVREFERVEGLKLENWAEH